MAHISIKHFYRENGMLKNPCIEHLNSNWNARLLLNYVLIALRVQFIALIELHVRYFTEVFLSLVWCICGHCTSLNTCIFVFKCTWCWMGTCVCVCANNLKVVCGRLDQFWGGPWILGCVEVFYRNVFLLYIVATTS